MNTHAAIWLSEFEQKLLETNSALGGQVFPVDHLYNLIAQYSPGPFTELEAMQIAPLLARALNVEQIEYLLRDAQHLCTKAAEDIVSIALHQITERTADITPKNRNRLPAMEVSAAPDWSYHFSLAPQGALLLALTWAVLPPGEFPEAMA